MASRLREFMREGGHEMKQTHAYEAIAKMLGYRNWNTLTTVSKRTDERSNSGPQSE